MAVVTVGPGNPRLLGNSEAKEALTEMQGMLERCRADAELGGRGIIMRSTAVGRREQGCGELAQLKCCHLGPVK